MILVRGRTQPQDPGSHSKAPTDTWSARGVRNSGNWCPRFVEQPANVRSEITNTRLHRRYQVQPAQCARTRTLRCRYSRPQQTLARKRQIRLCDPATVSSHNACRCKPVQKILLPIHLARNTLCRTFPDRRCSWFGHPPSGYRNRQVGKGRRHRAQSSGAGLASRGRLQAPAAPGQVARRTPRKSANRLMHRHIVKELPALADASLIYRQCRRGQTDDRTDSRQTHHTGSRRLPTDARRGAQDTEGRLRYSGSR